MSAHTPGPWVADPRETYNVRDAANDGVVAQIHFLRGRYGLMGRIPTEEAYANARLIAAAPDLLDVVERILSGESKEGALADAKSILARIKGVDMDYDNLPF